MANGSHPIIVFSHGYTGMFTDCTFLFEDLASHGYVVVSVAHTYETTAVEFPDGRFITSEFGSYLAPNTLRGDSDSLKSARSVRLADLKFVLNELVSLNTTAGNPFADRLDLLHVGVMGHSLGGEVAIASLEQETRLQAGVLIDGVVSDESTIGTGKPSVSVKWSVRNFITAFFDASLRNRADNPLLGGISSEYVGAALVTQKQSLCGLALDRPAPPRAWPHNSK